MVGPGCDYIYMGPLEGIDEPVLSDPRALALEHGLIAHYVPKGSDRTACGMPGNTPRPVYNLSETTCPHCLRALRGETR